jgi:hypothetical protein
MLLHLNFCDEWFDSNSKWDSKSFENALKYLKRKKKKEFTSSPRFRPGSPTLPRGPLASRARRSPRPAWAESGRWPSNPRERAAASGSHRGSLTLRTHLSGVFFLPTTPAGFPFLVSPDRIRRHNLPLPCLEHLRVIKTGCRTPPLHIAPRRKTNIVPRRLRGSRSRDRPPSRAPHRF